MDLEKEVGDMHLDWLDCSKRKLSSSHVTSTSINVPCRYLGIHRSVVSTRACSYSPLCDIAPYGRGCARKASSLPSTGRI
jgi:hypothetical protein